MGLKVSEDRLRYWVKVQTKSRAWDDLQIQQEFIEKEPEHLVIWLFVETKMAGLFQKRNHAHAFCQYTYILRSGLKPELNKLACIQAVAFFILRICYFSREIIDEKVGQRYDVVPSAQLSILLAVRRAETDVSTLYIETLLYMLVCGLGFLEHRQFGVLRGEAHVN
jgi:hypothetical protein